MKKPEARLCIAPLSLAGPEGAGRRLPGRLLPFFLRLGFADAHGIGQSTFSWRRKIKHGIMEPAGCAIHVAEENSPSPPLIMERMDPAVIIMEKAETAAAITAVKNASCIQMNILYAGSIFCLWRVWLHTAGFNPRNYFLKSQSLQLALQGISKLGLKA